MAPPFLRWSRPPRGPPCMLTLDSFPQHCHFRHQVLDAGLMSAQAFRCLSGCERYWPSDLGESESIAGIQKYRVLRCSSWALQFPAWLSGSASFSVSFWGPSRQTNTSPENRVCLISCFPIAWLLLLFFLFETSRTSIPVLGGCGGRHLPCCQCWEEARSPHHSAPWKQESDSAESALSCFSGDC